MRDDDIRLEYCDKMQHSIAPRTCALEPQLRQTLTDASKEIDRCRYVDVASCYGQSRPNRHDR